MVRVNLQVKQRTDTLISCCCHVILNLCKSRVVQRQLFTTSRDNTLSCPMSFITVLSQFSRILKQIKRRMPKVWYDTENSCLCCWMNNCCFGLNMAVSVNSCFIDCRRNSSTYCSYTNLLNHQTTFLCLIYVRQ